MSKVFGSDYEYYKQLVWDEYGSDCCVCDEPVDKTMIAGLPLSPEIDHVVPVSRGGAALDLANLRPSHKYCNQLKGTQPLSVARAKYSENIWRPSRKWFNKV